jgi:UDPglucose 6-dehydrogenase
MKKKLAGVSDITYVKDAYSAVKDADVAILMTEWNEFKEIDLKKLKEHMRTPNLIDARNIYNPERAKSLGFTYIGVGRL